MVNGSGGPPSTREELGTGAPLSLRPSKESMRICGGFPETTQVARVFE
jgi:hypothetical protein